MTQLAATPAAVSTDPQTLRATLLAAEVFVALHLARPAIRLASVSLGAGAHYESRVLPQAARMNRALLEEEALLLLAPAAARELLGGGRPLAGDVQVAEAERWLAQALCPDEAEEAASYVRALYARVRGLLRAQWVSVSVLSLGLQGGGTLNAAELRVRLDCVQGIRSALMN